MSFPSDSVIKNPPARQETQVESGSTPALEKGIGNLLQYSCLGNPVDRGAWRVQFMGLQKRWT